MEMLNSNFAYIFVKKWIDLRQIKTKMISGPFYLYCRIHFISGNASCFW